MTKNIPTYAVILILFFAIGCAVNPVTGKKQFTLISESQEVSIGDEQYPIMTQVSGGLFQDEGLQAYVNEVGQKLAKVSHRPNLKYEFNVVNSSELNAYALPGGKISITRGLISRMDNEAQVASVLGHEIGHVTARHVSSAYTRQLAAQLVLTAMTAYLKEKEVKHGEYYSLAGLLATQLMMLKFSRSQEYQADELGIQYMAKLNYNTEGYVQLLELLQSTYSREPTFVEGWMSSHPLTGDRIEASKSQVAQGGSASPDKTFNENDFKRKTKTLRQVAPAYQHHDQAEKMMAEGKIQQAIAEYKKAIEISPNQALFYSDLAFAYFKTNQLTESQTNIEKALQLYPDLFQSQFYSGLIHFQMKDYRRSLVSFDASDKLIPGHPSVKLNQGMCYENLLNMEMAVKKYQEALKLAGEGEIAEKAQERLNALGYSGEPQK
ncbi:M48 family metalloprotease [bacterium]|nr:M48 family metalloprotease [bacterium]